MPSRSRTHATAAHPSNHAPAARLLAERVALFSNELRERNGRFEELQGADPRLPQDPALLRSALDQLREQHEELTVADEELRAQVEELERSSERAERTQQQYREIFDACADVLLVTDTAGIIHDVNAGALRLFATEHRRLVGKPFPVLVDASDRTRVRQALNEIGRIKEKLVIKLSLAQSGERVQGIGAFTPVEDGNRVLIHIDLITEAHNDEVQEAHARIAALERALSDKDDLLAMERTAEHRRPSEPQTENRFVALLCNDLRPIQALLGWGDVGSGSMVGRGGAERAAPRANALDDDLEGARVLVAAADRELRELVADALVHHGALVTSATTAEEAIALFSSAPVEALITDLDLPGEDGCSLLRRLRDRAPELVAIAMHEAGGGLDAARALEAGFDTYFVKPFPITKLIAAVRDLVEEQESVFASE
jgi:PAS domain S-box-containing protein